MIDKYYKKISWLMTVVLGLLAVFAIFVTESFAQNVLAAPPPSQYNLDERGVDLITGALNLSTTERRSVRKTRAVWPSPAPISPAKAIATI